MRAAPSTVSLATLSRGKCPPRGAKLTKIPFSGMRDLSYPQVMNADLKIVDSRMSRVVKKIPRLGRYLTGAAVAILAFTIIYQGSRMFPESTFQLASESRLPKWITLPPGLTRSDVSIKMSYFTWPSAGFVLQDAKGQTLEKVDGKVRCSDFRMKNPPPGFLPGYPSYTEIVVKGTSELIEHRKMEPVFYITDDPAVWKEYRTVGCSS
jgi:hypothetical protein